MDWNEFFKPSLWKLAITLSIPLYVFPSAFFPMPLVLFYFIQLPALLAGYGQALGIYILPPVINYLLSCVLVFLSRKYFPETNQKLLATSLVLLLPTVYFALLGILVRSLTIALLLFPVGIFFLAALLVYKLSKNKRLVTAIVAFIIVAQVGYYLFFSIFLATSGWDGYLVCNSSDPVNIIVKAMQLNPKVFAGSTEPIGTIILINRTGGEISNVSCVGRRGFAANVPGCPSTVVGSDTMNENEFELNPLPGPAGTYPSSTIEIQYTDYAGLERSATITCSGPLEISEPTLVDKIVENFS